MRISRISIPSKEKRKAKNKLIKAWRYYYLKVAKVSQDRVNRLVAYKVSKGHMPKL